MKQDYDVKTVICKSAYNPLNFELLPSKAVYACSAKCSYSGVLNKVAKVKISLKSIIRVYSCAPDNLIQL